MSIGSTRRSTTQHDAARRPLRRSDSLLFFLPALRVPPCLVRHSSARFSTRLPFRGSGSIDFKQPAFWLGTEVSSRLSTLGIRTGQRGRSA